MSPFDISAHVNKLVEAHEKTLLVVYGQLFHEDFYVPNAKLGLRDGTTESDTHQALLYGVEEIEE